MYNDPSLQLIGSPPPTAGSRPGSSASNMFLFSDRSYQHGNGKSSHYENELFGPPSGRSSASSRPPSGRLANGFNSKPPRTPSTPVNNKTQVVNKKNKSSGKKSQQPKHKSSYTDELLFGSTAPTAEDKLWESSYGARRVAQTPTSSERSANNSNFYTKNLHKSGTEKPVTRPASRQSVNRRSPSPTSTRPQTATDTRSSSASSPKKKNRNRHNASYVDEMLFGPKLKEADFPAPWEIEREAKPYTFDMTDYKAKVQSGSDKVRPSSAINSTSRPPSARPSSRQNLPARPSSRCSNTVNGKPPTPRKDLFKKSYVDESLFGPKMEECDWDAPWENLKEKNKKPLIYDSSDYKMKVEHSDIPRPKPKVMSSLHKAISRSTSSLDKKPAWR